MCPQISAPRLSASSGASSLDPAQLITAAIEVQLASTLAVPAAETRDPVEWARLYVRTERAQPLDFDAHPYMPHILADQSEFKGYVCGSQVGKTTLAICEALWLADTWERPVRIIYTMHTDGAVQEFSQTRARPAIEGSPYLAGKIGGIDNVHRKSLVRRDGQSIIFFKGAQVGTQALSEPADIVIHDELDFSRPDVLRLYEDRTAHSDMAWRRAFGTPTLPGFGLSGLWEESTQTEWLVRCPRCDDERPIAWPESFAVDADPPQFICAHGHRLTWDHDISAGRWVQQQPKAQWSMYHIPRALLPNWPAQRIVAAFEAESFPHLFLNQVMGQSSTSGELTIDEDIIQACLGEQLNAERDDGPCFMGVDPGAVIHVAVGGRSAAPRQYVRMGHVDTWEQLAQLMALFNVQMAVVDGAYDATKAREFAAQFPGRVWLAYYTTQPIKGDEPVRRSTKQRRLDLDRTATLDVSAQRLVMQQDSLPRCDFATHQEMVSQLTAMVRGTETGADGRPRAFWQEVRADHIRHAHNYATVAAELLGGQEPGEIKAYIV